MPTFPTSLALLAALVPSVRAQELASDRRRTPVVEVVERVKPAVVSISSEIRTRAWYGYRDEPSAGTGVVLFEDGYIITNNHVVQGANTIQVTFDPADDPRVYPAVIISQNPDNDLALIKIESDEPFHTITLCESDPILGETVIAIGNAFRHSHTVSTGIVSGLHREIQTREGQVFSNLIQTDASINPGNSGGPLLNIEGELIGINSAMQGMAENIGFAIPVAHVRKVLAEKLLSLDQARAWLGFDVDENDLSISRIEPDSPAAQAGLQKGDRLRALAGHLLTTVDGDPRDVYRRVRLSIQPGKEVALRVARGSAEREFKLTGWNQVDGFLFERLGLGLQILRTGTLGETPFLQVTSVQEGGPAGQAGLQAGDILSGVRRPRWTQMRWLQSVQDMAFVVSSLEPGTPLEIVIWRDEDGDQIYNEQDPRTGYSEVFKGKIVVR